MSHAKSIITKISLALLLSLSSTASISATDDNSRTSTSISFQQSTSLSTTSKNIQFQNTEANTMPVLIKAGARKESLAVSTDTKTFSYSYSTDYTLYDATTDLISDFDYDGFYHRFNVAIDADTVFDTSLIYVRLYLSYEGGPWNHYASSNDYLIHGDSADDTFIIETELADGFPAGYYDVRIELYDAYTHEWLLSYGPYNDDSLSALPLEDNYYDDGYDNYGFPIETQVVFSGNGSMGWLLLLIPAFLITARRYGPAKTH